MQHEPHDEFLELCAISASGQLSEEDQKRLDGHLAVCPICREAWRDYEAVIDRAIPTIAANEDLDDIPPGPGWSQERAEKAFFKRLAGEEKRKGGKVQDAQIRSRHLGPLASSVGGPTWPQVWMLYAAGILLFASLGFYALRTHPGRHAEESEAYRNDVAAKAERSPSLEEQLSEVGRERELAQAEVRKRDQLIGELRRQLAEESASIAQMKATQERLKSEIQDGKSGREDLANKQSQLQAKLEASESHSRNLEARMKVLSEQAAQDQARAQVLESKNADLTRLLEDREAALERQDQFLAHDRDIRDLMGARDLYIAEVYDIARTGETKKPYGRVFYTRGKSLIFYAYDLDRDADARSATSFQAWGRRGTNREQALNLGIFYEDNVSRKRWILKCEGPKTLAQIDGVFVTIEPSGGSQKPSGKSLLSAYLKINPNHP